MWRLLPPCALLLWACGEGELVIIDPEPPPTHDEAAVSGGDPANQAVYGLDLSMWEGPIAQSEMDCFWSAGVRHIVSGTQVEEVTRQQLEMARTRGMSLDAYVYLRWSGDMREQVRVAFARVQGFGIGRMWLDAEEVPSPVQGATALLDKLQLALDECRLYAPVDCGIYTGKGFWDGSMGNSTRFADVPLWYARYNDIVTLDAWATERFGGWPKAVAKQWAERPLCGVGPDHDTMQVLVGPELVIDRTTPPAPTTVPPAPAGLYPSSHTNLDVVKLMVATIPHATQYDHALESWSGTAWVPYTTWRTAAPFKVVSPAYRNRFFRYRARALNAFGWGPFSAYSTFELGTATSQPQLPGVDAGTPPPPPPPPADAGTPGALTPDGNATFASGAAVKLQGPAEPGATLYEFAIESSSSGAAFVPYFTYTASVPNRTFYPQGVRSFRWRIRALGAWSAWATFRTN